MVGYELIGVDKVVKNLQMVQSQIRMSCPTGLDLAADKLRDYALNNLQGSLGTSNPTWGKWGHSIYQKAISDKASWEKEHSKYNETILKCVSEHAAIVEVGGTVRIDAEDYGHQMWPIGQEQGKIPIYRQSFHLQVGYHYLTNATCNPSAYHDMCIEIGRTIGQTLARTLGRG